MFTNDQLAIIAAAAIAATKTVNVTPDRESDTNYLDDTYSPLIGKIVAIRTVTMTNVGRLEAVMPQAFIISDAVWIANTGRWGNFCKTGQADEVESFGPGPVWVAKGGLIDIAELPAIPKAKQ